MTKEQRRLKTTRQRERRERERVAMLGKAKRAPTCGFSDTSYTKYTYRLASIVSKACNAFFERRGIPYQYQCKRTGV